MSLYTVLMGSSESFRHSSQTQSPAPNYSRSFSCLFLECLISCSAIWRCSTLYTTINKFLYIHTQFLLIFVQNVYFRNSVPTKTWEQPSRKSVLNPPVSTRDLFGEMPLLAPAEILDPCCHQGGIHLLLHQEWEGQGAVRHTCTHRHPVFYTAAPARGWSDPQPAALPGLAWLNAKSIPLFPG